MVETRRKDCKKFEVFHPGKHYRDPIQIYFNTEESHFEANVKGVQMDDESLKQLKTKIVQEFTGWSKFTWTLWIVLLIKYEEFNWDLVYLAKDEEGHEVVAYADWGGEEDKYIEARKKPLVGNRKSWLRSDAARIEFTWERVEALQVVDTQLQSFSAQIHQLVSASDPTKIVDAISAGKIDPVCEFLRLSAEAGPETKKLFKTMRRK